MSSDAIPPSQPPGNPGPDESIGDAAADPFAPPAEPCECYCLHCHRVFMSDGMWFQRVIHSLDGCKGFWKCATPNCDGEGFTFDIFPTDPSHPANAGWSHDETDDEGDEAFDTNDEPPAEYDPAEPHYAAMDEHYGDDEDDDDLEGEEWKHGMEPGERPPEPAWVAEARQRWEEEQRKYDAPDERPRVVDWSDRPARPPYKPPESSGGDIDDSDIPF